MLGVGEHPRTLAETIVPIQVDRALDLGTGCGIQALLVARRAGTVIATDISQRALAFAELNARLNGVVNIEFRHGSMFEPVAGEAFDLIVSNPPFVITPRVEGVPAYEYRDGGLVGDALVEQFVRSAPAYLTQNGIAQLLGNWESRSGITGLARLEAWVPSELDLWVIEREELTPLGYAELWIRDGGTTPRDPAFTPLLTAWLDDFAARGVTSIGFGYVLMRRGAPEHPLRRTERIAQQVSNVGTALGTGLAAHDVLAEGIPSTLVTAPDVTEARHLLPGNDDPSVIELRQGGGFARTVNVDPALAGFVGACDGELTVVQIASALADLFEVPLPDLWAELEPRIRSLVLDGILVPGESSPDLCVGMDHEGFRIPLLRALRGCARLSDPHGGRHAEADHRDRRGRRRDRCERRLRARAPLGASGRLADAAAGGHGGAHEAHRGRHGRDRHALREPVPVRGGGGRSRPDLRRSHRARREPWFTRDGSARIRDVRLRR